MFWAFIFMALGALYTIGILPDVKKKEKKNWKRFISWAAAGLMLLAGIVVTIQNESMQKKLIKSQATIEAIMNFSSANIGVDTVYARNVLVAKFSTFLIQHKKTGNFIVPNNLYFLNELWQQYFQGNSRGKKRPDMFEVDGGTKVFLIQRGVITWLAWIYNHNWRSRIVPYPEGLGWSLVADNFTIQESTKVSLREILAQAHKNPFANYGIPGENEGISLPPHTSLIIGDSSVEFRSEYVDVTINVFSPMTSVLRPRLAMNLGWKKNAIREFTESTIDIEMKAIFKPDKVDDSAMRDYRRWVLNLFRNFVFSFRWDNWQREFRNGEEAIKFQK